MTTEQYPGLGIGGKLRAGLGLLNLFVFAIAVYFIAGQYDLLEHVLAFSREHEEWEVDEIFIVSFALLFVISFISMRQWRKLKQVKQTLLLKNKSLEEAFTEIKQLKGIIPICSSCKKIRDQSGSWHQVEVYVKKHTEAQFSHGMCPECMSKIYSGKHEIMNEDN